MTDTDTQERRVTGPTDETKEHGDYLQTKSHKWRNLFEWPPQFLFERTRTLTQEQYNACCTFYRDYTIAGLVPRMCFDPLMVGGGGRHEMSDSAAEANARWKAAYLSIHGAHGKSLAVDIICHGYYARQLMRHEVQDLAHVLTKKVVADRYRSHIGITSRLVDATDDLVAHYEHPTEVRDFDHILSEREREMKKRFIESLNK